LIHTGNIEDTKKLIAEIEEDLHLVDSWMKRNDMKLNKDKTKLCVFGSKLRLRKLNESMDKISIQFNDVTVSPDDTILCLGLTLNKHMTWKTHINLLNKKLNFTLNSTHALQPYLDSHELYILISSYLISQITYMICLWGQASNHYLIRLSPNLPEAKVLLWKKINKKAAIIQQSAIKSAACKLLLKIRI